MEGRRGKKEGIKEGGEGREGKGEEGERRGVDRNEKFLFQALFAQRMAKNLPYWLC